MNGIQYWPAGLQSLPAGPQCNHAPLRTQSHCPLSVKVREMSKFLLQRRLQTGLSMKPTFFMKLGPPNSVSCKELHTAKKSRFGMIYILCIDKGSQRAKEMPAESK